MERSRLEPHDALLVVDVQNDFCPGGTLPIEDGDRVVPVLNCWIEAARKQGATIVVSRDWHPPGHISFRDSGGPWPAHCLQNTWGAAFHRDLNIPDNVRIVSKGTALDRDEYSGFEPTLAAELANKGIRRLWIGGLAQDVCVRATVLDALKAGLEVHLIREATRPVNLAPGDGDRALQEMRLAGCIIEEGESHA
jgi:nicotinamidase/pyrazinamidase